MADYAIGDLQGCYQQFMSLLERIQFNPADDRLWLVGDLVNRGPDSLLVLRFLKHLPKPPRITLGNHDFHLLSRLFTDNGWRSADDTLDEILKAPDRDELGHWLRQQPVLYYDQQLNVVMSHAGIAPVWDLPKALLCARELEETLRGECFFEFLTHMYGNQPNDWSDDLQGIDRLRAICNYFTRMRFCDRRGRLDFTYKGTIADAPQHLIPWYDVPQRKPIPADMVFGHWAALSGQSAHPHLYAIDTGCLWGGRLTALRLQDKKRFTVPGVSQ